MARLRRVLVEFCLISLTVISWVIMYHHKDDSCYHLQKFLVHSQFNSRWFAEVRASMFSAEEIYRYLHWTNSTSCHFAVDFGFSVFDNEGIASPDGHKAICLDKGVSPIYNNCLVYSFGINYQWSFDDAMEEYGCQVYSFDPSMNVGDHNRSSNIHFYNVGLSGSNYFDPELKWNMKTASSVYEILSQRHGVKPIDVFKMDVEFAEWNVIPQMLQSDFLSKNVKQLAVEIHFKENDPLKTFVDRVRILQKLESSTESGGRFVRFSSRPNPWLERSIYILGGKTNFIGFELAWYNSRYYKESEQINNNSV